MALGQKGRFTRYLPVIKLRNFESSEDFATKRPRKEYYIRMLVSS